MDYTLCKVFFPLMAIRGMALDDYCTLCNAYPETLSHALGDCTWVRGAWNNLGINDTWNFFQHNVHRWIESNICNGSESNEVGEY